MGRGRKFTFPPREDFKKLSSQYLPMATFSHREIVPAAIWTGGWGRHNCGVDKIVLSYRKSNPVFGDHCLFMYPRVSTEIPFSIHHPLSSMLFIYLRSFVGTSAACSVQLRSRPQAV
jgi:hypothetical protein